MKWKKDLRIIDIHSTDSQKVTVPGLKEIVLSHNRFGANFLKHVLTAIKEDNYLRVLDLRKNRLSAAVIGDCTNYDIVKSLSENDSLTNIDLRENEGYD